MKERKRSEMKEGLILTLLAEKDKFPHFRQKVLNVLTIDKSLEIDKTGRLIPPFVNQIDNKITLLHRFAGLESRLAQQLDDVSVVLLENFPHQLIDHLTIVRIMFQDKKKASKVKSDDDDDDIL